MGVLLLWLLACIAACGDDAAFFFAVRFGTVVSDADCHAGGGSFDLRESQGLTVVVIITGDTNILLASGGGGTCGDIRGNSPVEVRGDEANGTIRARAIQLGA
jgi:hypothetical protein